MTKKEKVKDVYQKLGFTWSKIEKLISENGVLILPSPDLKYSLEGYENLVADKEKFSAFGSEGLKLQPSELSGIYNNNGWIKVESEVDLPKSVNIMYRIGMFLNDGRFHQDKNLVSHETAIKALEWNYTHYIPITESEPPIY